ncbi:MAG: nucleotidyltransferase substrate binding protein [Myxococcota bacterium]|jgi:nucleotidyltransferase substrate binding protein (TIGR01987 family)
MNIDITPLISALISLEKAVVRSSVDAEDEELRDAVIQRFEYTIDLAWKSIQRVLKQEGVGEETIRTKRDLFREGARAGLINDPVTWFGYLESRNETSHIYKREVAQRVYKTALLFVEDAKVLVERLKGHPQCFFSSQTS